MLIDGKSITKLIDECAEIINELAKGENGEQLDKSTHLKFKSQLRDLQTEFA